jgi:putative FmdB family regulatory protein
MPIYEYECNDCSHQFEVMRKLSDGPLSTCPACGRETLQKLISKVAFRLKGTGWYETDFKNKPADGKADKQGGDADKGASTEKKDSAAKDDKPASTNGGASKTTAKTGE